MATILKLKIETKEYKMIFHIFLSSVLLKLMFYMPRFELKMLNDMKSAEYYAYYQSIAMTIEYISYFFIQSIYVPKLIKGINLKLLNKFRTRYVTW